MSKLHPLGGGAVRRGGDVMSVRLRESGRRPVSFPGGDDCGMSHERAVPMKHERAHVSAQADLAEWDPFLQTHMRMV